MAVADGYTDGSMLWMRSDLFATRPELMTSDATPIFLGSRGPPGMGGAGECYALGGGPPRSGHTQEMCASAMLALSSGRAPPNGGAVPAPYGHMAHGVPPPYMDASRASLPPGAIPVMPGATPPQHLVPGAGNGYQVPMPNGSELAPSDAPTTPAAIFCRDAYQHCQRSSGNSDSQPTQ